MMHAVANPIDTIKEHPHYVLLAPALVLLVGIFLIPIVALFWTSLQESVPIKRYEPGLTFDSYIRYLTDPCSSDRCTVPFVSHLSPLLCAYCWAGLSPT